MPGLPGDGVLDTEQHELFGEALPRPPPVVGRQAQAVGDLPEQGVAAVGGAEVDDGPLVGELHAEGVRRQGAAGHGHEVGDYVHRPAFGRPGQTGEELGFHLVGGTPVVVDAGVGRVGGRDGSPFLGPGGVLRVGACVVAALAGGPQFPGGEGFADEPGIVGGVDDLDTGGAGDGGPVCDELTDSVGQGVRDSGRAE